MRFPSHIDFGFSFRLCAHTVDSQCKDTNRNQPNYIVEKHLESVNQRMLMRSTCLSFCCAFHFSACFFGSPWPGLSKLVFLFENEQQWRFNEVLAAKSIGRIKKLIFFVFRKYFVSLFIFRHRCRALKVCFTWTQKKQKRKTTSADYRLKTANHFAIELHAFGS